MDHSLLAQYFKNESNCISRIPLSDLTQHFQILSLLSLPSSLKLIFIFTKIGSDDFFILIQHTSFTSIEIISISPDNIQEKNLLSNKLIELEKSLIKPITLLKNTKYPFFDTSHSNKILNSISLINLNSIKDFENKINEKIELQRFRANFYLEGVEAWQERNWIGKIIKINNVSFKVEKNIPRCIAINLNPNTDDNKLNLLNNLKKNFNHFDMGIYLTSINDGSVTIGDKVKVEL